MLYGRTKIFVVYASINFKDLEGRSADSIFFCTKTIPFPLSLPLLFLFTLHTRQRVSRTRDIRFPRRNENCTRVYIYAQILFMNFVYICYIRINLFKSRTNIFYLKLLFNQIRKNFTEIIIIKRLRKYTIRYITSKYFH